MAEIRFEVRRTVSASVDEVFARLADIEGHNDWVLGRGSMLSGTRQTSPGPVGVGTTYEDSSRMGVLPGVVEVHEPPRRLVYHWQDRSRSGRVKTEGWPGYTLDAVGEHETLVRHDARLRANGAWVLAVPLLRILARRERTAVLDALQRSFA